MVLRSELTVAFSCTRSRLLGVMDRALQVRSLRRCRCYLHTYRSARPKTTERSTFMTVEEIVDLNGLDGYA